MKNGSHFSNPNPPPTDVEGIILAAGFSSRAGVFKPGLLLWGKPLLQHCLEGMAACCARILVVGGYQLERVKELTESYPGVRLVFNRDYPKGMFSSVQAGIRHVEAQSCFLVPGDYPLVRPGVYEKLLDSDGDIVIPTLRGRRGHPLLLRRPLLEDLLKEPADSNLREFIRKRAHLTVEVEVEAGDEGILLDVDTPGDLRDIRAKYGGKNPHEESQDG